MWAGFGRRASDCPPIRWRNRAANSAVRASRTGGSKGSSATSLADLTCSNAGMVQRGSG